MNSPKGQYSGAIDCAFRMYQKEGSHAFYKGYSKIMLNFFLKKNLKQNFFFLNRFVPSFARMVSWNIVLWISYEQIKHYIFMEKAISNEN